MLAPSAAILKNTSVATAHNLGLPPTAQPRTPSIATSETLTDDATTSASPEAHQPVQTANAGVVVAPRHVATPLERPPLPPPPAESELRALKMMELRAQALDMGIDPDTVEDVRR